MLSGSVAVALVLLPERWLSPEGRAVFAVVGSSVLTLAVVVLRRDLPEWGMLETACLLVLLVRTCRRAKQPRVVLVLVLCLTAAVIDEPMRTGGMGITLTYPFLLTFATGGAIALGCYLRSRDDQRVRVIAAVRQAERMRLARDLHDFVAHHVSGIIAQAHAGDTLHKTAPESVGPILRNIVEAGQQTMQSMRKLVRVLREDETAAVEVGGLFEQLARLVALFESQGAGSTVRLEITEHASATNLLPEVESAVYQVVQESLTNVRRHAPGSQVHIRVHENRAGMLRVEVHNTMPPSPVGRRSRIDGGFGLVGLRERAAALGGSITTGPSDDGGWCVISHFPATSKAVARDTG
ncbi:histidine kinase [Streptomyces sp. NPDC005811]|uniref:sensor histidine kinase n=1 Tax=Streptomyces sp. NPDC005811 TaxID=3154565 RepID=UPI00340F23DD